MGSSPFSKEAITMNNVAAGKWKQFRGEIKRKWAKLTDDDLLRIEGDYDKLVGALQERYGKSAEEADREARTFFDTLH